MRSIATHSGNQTWQQVKEQVDLQALASELAKLKIALQSAAQKDEEFVDVEMIGLAEHHAREGQGSKAFALLRRVGKWTLDTATNIGVPIATNVIKAALGLP